MRWVRSSRANIAIAWPLISIEPRTKAQASPSMAVNNPSARNQGFSLAPSLLDNVRPGMRCYDDEIFGPVLSVVRVETYEQALAITHETRMATAQRFSPAMEAPLASSNLAPKSARSASTCPFP